MHPYNARHNASPQPHISRKNLFGRTSAYMKSASIQDLIKRNAMIQRLLFDLKDEVKRKNGALEKYDAFYREVKAWSAEKARQREPHSMNNIPLILNPFTTVMSFRRLRLLQCYSLFIAYPCAPRV